MRVIWNKKSKILRIRRWMLVATRHWSVFSTLPLIHWSNQWGGSLKHFPSVKLESMIQFIPRLQGQTRLISAAAPDKPSLLLRFLFLETPPCYISTSESQKLCWVQTHPVVPLSCVCVCVLGYLEDAGAIWSPPCVQQIVFPCAHEPFTCKKSRRAANQTRACLPRRRFSFRSLGEEGGQVG